MGASTIDVTARTTGGVQSGTAERLSSEELRRIDAYWRACNYLAAGMIYLRANPLLREPLKVEHIKQRLLGHWGTSPGLSFTYIHLNRLIKKYDLNAIFLAGPGHGAPGVLAPAYLEGTYSEIYPNKSEDRRGMRKFFKEFSFPGGIGSHCTPETPGSIHEGGELGYSISHAFGAAFDNPDLLVAVVVGDGESETGPLATSWHSNKFLNPIRDGAVLPILHLNGYKINNPTVLSRISHDELENLFKGYGWTPHFVEGSDPASMHQKMAATLEDCVLEIRRIQQEARASGKATRARLAHDRAAQPQGLDRPQRSGRPQGRRLLARAPGAAGRRAREPGPSEAAGRVAAQLQAGRAVRRERPVDSGTQGPGAQGRPAHERQSARQRRPAAQGAAHAGFPRLRHQGEGAGADSGREHAAPGPLPARHHAQQPEELPRLRPRRNHFQQARCRLRGEQEAVAGRLPARGCRRRRTVARRPGDGNAFGAHA